MDRTANHFINYLYSEYRGSRHVRRVASWIGFILKGIERVGAINISFRATRQLSFEYRGHIFKVRYDHQVGTRGGIEILEVLPGRGSPDGRSVICITKLREAEDVYLGLGRLLDSVVDSGQTS